MREISIRLHAVATRGLTSTVRLVRGRDCRGSPQASSCGVTSDSGKQFIVYAFRLDIFYHVFAESDLSILQSHF